MKPSENFENSPSSRDLLSSLSRELSQKYGIEASSVERMLTNKTKLSLQEFRNEMLSNGNSSLSENQTEELYHSIEGYKKLVIEHTKFDIETLKSRVSNDLSQTESIGNTVLKNIFPTMMQRVQNPKTLSDEFTWAILWALDSGITFWYICYKIGLWIIKSPYDLYLITSWKWTYKNWKRI